MFIFCLLFAPLVASATLFPTDSVVRLLDTGSFRSVLQERQTSMIAFISPSGLEDRFVTGYSKAALGLHPYIPAYAVDCGEEINKPLCSEQLIKVFPTVKLFPRGTMEPPITYDSSDTETEISSAYYYWASRRIPNHVTKIYHVEDIQPWIEKTKSGNVVLLLTKEKKVPLLWKVLANKYAGELELALHRDRKGKSSIQLGFERGEKDEVKVLVYPSGSVTPTRFKGLTKLDTLSKFFESIISNPDNLDRANKEAEAEEFVPDEKELEIERRKEAQRLALAHGGFVDLIDFEKAIKEGHGASYHDVHGYPGMMSKPPVKEPQSDNEETANYSREGVFEKRPNFKANRGPKDEL